MNEKLEIWKGKLIELEEKVKQLHNYKSSLINIFDELNRRTNIELNDLLDDIELQDEISCLSYEIEFCSKCIEGYEAKVKSLQNIRGEVSGKEEIIENLKSKILKRGISGEILTAPAGNLPRKKQRVKKAKPLIKYIIPFIILLLIFGGLFFLRPKIIGYVVRIEEINYSDSLNLVINESSSYDWFLEHPGKLKSVRLDGSINKEGYAKVYLEYRNESYLIFDSDRLKKEGLGIITGLVVSDLITNDSLDNKSEEIVDLINESEPLNKNSVINNSIDKKIKITTEGGGRKDIEDMFEFNISGGFNWDVSYDKVCTKWDVNSVSLCYGSVDCCALIGLQSLGSWNSSFYLSYGRYGAGLKNVIRAQVIYANYSLEVENPYADIVYSDIKELTAEFYKAVINFKDICVETCLLPGFNESSYRLVFIIENATLQIDNIRYSVEKMVNISRNAPALVKEIENITIYKNEFIKINLSEYFYDEDKDKLTYSAYKADNITVSIAYSDAILLPDSNFTGRRYMYFTASDGYYKVSSNIFSINVIEKPLSVEEVNISEILIKPSIRINEPVKWVKVVNASASVINLSVNISSDALNVTVRDIKENRIISEDRIKINDNGVIKNVSAYMAEKRIEQIERIEDELTRKKEGIIMERPTAKQEIGSINKELLELENERNRLTGYVVATLDKGAVTEFFEWLFNVDITGYAVKDKVKEEKNKTKDIEVIIEEPVEDIIVEYYTEAPISEEVYVNEYIKRIIVSSDIHYENILAYTNISPEASSSAIRLYRIVNESRELVNNVSYYDKNNNSLIDRIEWIIPSLSNETYELIIEISKAVHLDSNRSFISDIYEEVKALDGNWSEAINNNEYVRVTFKRALDNTRDITIYARASNNNSAEIEVYTENNDTLITKFENVSSENWYKVYLTNLNGSYDVFDLKIKRNSVEFDYIVDPTVPPQINFTSPTPANGTIQTQTYVEINVSIIEENLSEVKFNWNGTNYTIYNDSLVLMFNFDNISALGEQTSGSSNKTVDISKYGHNGTLYGGAGPTWTSNGRYGGAFDFDNADDYIMLPHSTAWNFTGPFSISVWIKTDANPGLDGIVTRGTSIPYVWYLRFLDSDTLQFGMDGDSVDYTWPPTIGVWYYIVAVWNGTSRLLYIDGSFRLSEVEPNPPTANSDRVYIGVDYTPTSGRVFPGLIDEVMIFNRSLSAAEIQQLYFTNLYKFNQTQWYLYVNQSKDATTRLKNGTYTYYASAKDVNGNENVTETRTIYINSTIPDITLNNPADGANLSSNFITFNWTVTDITDDSLTCNLTINSTVNKSNIATTSGTHQNFTPTSFAEGFYVWNVTCWDDDSNVNTSVTRNFTVSYLYPNCPDTDGNLTITSDTHWVRNYTCENVVVTNNAILWFNNSNAGNTYLWLIANNTRIDDGASISASGKGYAAQTGTGAGNDDGGNYDGGSGAGYGGIGGYAYGEISTSGGISYGSITEPIDLGSGGGDCNGGRGGGAILLNISGTLNNTGRISLNGNDGGIDCDGLSYDGSGGGSGGSIWIIAGIITGNGNITADGGDGGSDTYDGGGGAGGRIAVYYSTYDYLGLVRAYSGNELGDAEDGGAGTVYIKNQSSGLDKIILGSGSTNDVIAPVGNINITADEVFVQNYTSYNGTIRAGNVTVESGATFTHTYSLSTRTYYLNIYAENMVIEEGASVNVNGKGYPAQTGTGAGNDDGGNYDGGSGAGYGGIGGYAYGEISTSGGISYGSITEPIDLGSGGGDCNGGRGGGAILLNISGTLNNTGRISLNGNDGGIDCDGLSYDGSGGGSGGSIWIIAGIITGNGNITADGGDGGDDTYDGGGGAGGRIAIFTITDQFTGSISAYNSTGPGTAGEGNAGSIFKCNYISGFDCRGDSEDKLILENGSVRLETAFDFNYTVNITREVASYWNNSYVKFNDTSSNLTRVATYNASGLLASTMYNLKDNSVRFNVTFTDGGGVLPIYSRTLSSEHEMLIEKTIDADEPWVTIVYPVDGALYTIDVTQLNYTVLDTNNDSCWYSTDNGATNSTAVAAGQNFTNVVSVEGWNTWIVYCNDSDNNRGSDSVTFYQDSIYPQINFTSPTPSNGTSQSQTYVEVNVSIIEQNLSEAKFNWNGTNYTIFNDSLVFMFNFDNLSDLGESNSNVVDLAGGDNNGTPDGVSFSSSTKIFEKSAYFDGNSHEISCNTTNIPTTLPVTLMAWVYFPNNQGSGDYDYVLKASTWVSGTDMWIIARYATTNRFYYWGDSGAKYGPAIPTAQWTHIAIVFRGSTPYEKLYINGENVSVDQTSSTAASEGQFCMVGANAASGASANSMTGYIDEARMYDRELSQSEIQQLYFTHLYKHNQSQWYLYVNQSKNATTGLDNGTYTYSASAKDSSGNENTTETRIIHIDLAPTVTIIYPTATIYAINVSNLNYTTTEDGYCWYSNSSGEWNSTAVTAGQNFTNVVSVEGYNTWTVYCNDSIGSIGSSSVTFFKDTIYPQINFTAPTPSNGTSQSKTYVEVNVSVNELNLNEVKFNWNGSNYTYFNDSLVLMFNFDNVSALGEDSTHVNDSSGYGNNGTVKGDGNEVNTTGAARYGRGGLQLDGTGDYVDLGGFNDLDGASGLTISFWIYDQDSGTFDSHRGIFARGSTGQRVPWIWGTQSANYIYTQIEISGTVADCNLVFGNSTDGTWTHYVVTWAASDNLCNGYVDGKFNKSDVTTGSQLSNTDGTNFIGYINGFGSWQGKIDEVMIWNRSLSADEIKQLYFSNLRKYDTDKWALYINQSKNATNGLSDGVYTYSASAKDTVGNENSTETRSVTIDTTIPSFSNNQTNASSTTYNGTTVQINLTITDSGGLDYYRLTINDTQDNTWGNKTIYDGNDAVSVTAIFNYSIMNISSNGGVLGWKVWANDSAGNVNVSDIYTFTVQAETTPPTVTLNYPPASYYNDTLAYTYFNCTASDTSGIMNISLWLTNSSNASFSFNMTNSSSMSLNTFNVTYNLSIGNYTWNCYSCDVLSNCGFASSNRTVEMRPITVDNIQPSFSNNQTNASSTTYNGTTVQINLTITDSGGIDYYRLTINDTQDNTWGNKTIYNGNSATSVTAIFNYTIMNISSSGGVLGWKVWANDSAGNVNISQIYTLDVAAANTAPTIPYVESGISANPTANSTTTIYFMFNASDANGASDINTSRAAVNVTLNAPGGQSRANTSCTNISTSGNVVQFNCSVKFYYYDNASSNWIINATIYDNSNAIGINDTVTFTYNSLSAMYLVRANLTFTNLNLGQQDVAADSPIILNNTGNFDFNNISITAYQLYGVSNSSYVIGAGNFTVNTTNAQAGIGLQLQNATPLNLSGATLPHRISETDTGGNETLYFWLDVPDNTQITVQNYNSTTIWQVTVE